MSETATTEVTPTPAASEADQRAAEAAAAGAAADGAGSESGSQADADTFAAERARLEATARGLQSEKDRLATELAALRATTSKTEAVSEPAPLTEDGLLALLSRRDAIASAKAALPTEFPNADPTILARADQYESAEALRAAMESSHQTLTAHIEARAKTASDTRVQAYVDKFGELETPPASTDSTPTADPTIEQLAAMSMSEFDKVPQETIDRVMRSASTGGK